MKRGAIYINHMASIDRKATTAVKSIRCCVATPTKKNILLLLLSWGVTLVAISGYNTRAVDIISSVYMHIDHSPRSFFLYPYLEYRGSYPIARSRFDGSNHPLRSSCVFPVLLKVFRDRNHS